MNTLHKHLKEFVLGIKELCIQTLIFILIIPFLLPIAFLIVYAPNTLAKIKARLRKDLNKWN